MFLGTLVNRVTSTVLLFYQILYLLTIKIFCSDIMLVTHFSSDTAKCEYAGIPKGTPSEASLTQRDETVNAEQTAHPHRSCMLNHHR